MIGRTIYAQKASNYKLKKTPIKTFNHDLGTKRMFQINFKGQCGGEAALVEF